MASLHAAVTSALAKLSTNRVDTLFVATPPEVGVAALLYCTVLYCTVLQMFPLVGIGSGASGQEQDEARQQLLGEDRDTVTLVTPGTDPL